MLSAYADDRAELEHCVSEYNSLLSQCQSEINRANNEISTLSNHLSIAKAEVEESKKIELFSWKVIRGHVEHFIPSLVGRSFIPSGTWKFLESITDENIRPRIPEDGRVGFLKSAPLENILVFIFTSGWAAWVVLRMVFSRRVTCPVSKRRS